MHAYRFAPRRAPTAAHRSPRALPALIVGFSALLHVAALAVAANAARGDAAQASPPTRVVRVLHGQAIASDDSDGSIRFDGFARAVVRDGP
jgi:hypothetical protein